jgi:hypothetical protein
MNQFQTDNDSIGILLDGDDVMNTPTPAIDKNPRASMIYSHCKVASKICDSGKHKGSSQKFFYCKYCARSFQGPGSSSFKRHLIDKHPDKCPELIPSDNLAAKSDDFFW